MNGLSTWVLKFTVNNPPIYAVKVAASRPDSLREINEFLIDAAILYSFSEATMIADYKQSVSDAQYGVRLHEFEHYALDRSSIEVIIP